MENKIIFIGEIETPYKTIEQCPRNVSADGPECRIKIYEEFKDGLFGLKKSQKILVMYWLNLSERSAGISSAYGDTQPLGTFALRTPVRPNPIGVGVVQIEDIQDNVIIVKGLDCLSGTKLIDIKPHID